MNEDIGIYVLADSGQWHQFLESLATALQLNLILYVMKNNFYMNLCNACPICKSEIPFKKLTIPDNMSDAEEPIYITNSDVKQSVFKLDNGVFIIAQGCRHCRRDGIISFYDSVDAASDLIRCLYKAMKQQWNPERVSAETHRTVHLILTKLRRGGNILDRALDVILSASVLLFKADGGWIEYEGEGKNGLLVKGDCDKIPSIWSLKDRDFIVANLMRSGISGKMTIKAPAEYNLAGRLLDLMVQECGTAIEIDHLMETTESKFNLIVESVESAVMVVDKYMSIAYINWEAGNILELSATRWVSLSVHDIAAPWNSCILSKTEKPAKGIKNKFNNRFVNWSVYPIREAEDIIGWLIIADDCTDDYRIQELGQSAERMAEFEALFSSLAHEIKNPLATFRGLLQLIRLNELSDDIYKYIDLGIKEVDRVSHLINDFTLMRKPPEYSSELIDMGDFINEIMPILNGQIIGKSTKIITDFDPVYPIRADPEQLTQVMVNLVKNAFEAIDENGSIIVGLRSIKHDWVEITVRDNGPGFEQEMDEKIFEPFFSTKENGTGLGLSICKFLVQNHGGGFFAKNHPDGGAAFSILLPTGHYMNDKKKMIDVLLIVDDETLCNSLKHVLKAEDLSILSASDMDHAVFFMEKYIISIAVIDNAILNPKDSVKMKRNQVSIMLLISDHESVHNSIGKDLDVAVCLTKPLDYAMFVNAVWTLIE